MLHLLKSFFTIPNLIAFSVILTTGLLIIRYYKVRERKEKADLRKAIIEAKLSGGIEEFENEMYHN